MHVVCEIFCCLFEGYFGVLFEVNILVCVV